MKNYEKHLNLIIFEFDFTTNLIFIYFDLFFLFLLSRTADPM